MDNKRYFETASNTFIIKLFIEILLIGNIKNCLYLNMMNSRDKKDTGLRGRFNGELYVDKKVFFSRTEVRDVLRSVMDSPVLKKQLKRK